MQVKWPLYVYFLLICLIFVLVLTHQIGIKKSQEKEFEFQGGSKPTRRLTETRSRAKIFGAKILPQH